MVVTFNSSISTKRSGSRSNLYNNLFEIPTFTEIIDFVQDYYESSGFLIGIYPELKVYIYDIFTTMTCCFFITNKPYAFVYF